MPETLRTACARDCPDACGMLAEVDANGRVLSLRGDKDHPITRGFLCERTSQFLKRQYHRQRLTTPLLRRSGRLEPCGWDQALDHVATELARIRSESGPEAVLHYRSGGSLGILKTLNSWFFECFGGARVKLGDICSGAGEAAQEADMGVSEAHALDDLLNSRTILLWGRNLMTSFLHTVPLVKQARAGGARVWLIDPAPGRTERLADRVLRPRPGADRFLALGVAQVLIAQGRVAPDLEQWSLGWQRFRELALSRPLDEWASACDVGVDEIEALAADYADGPSNIQVGWGLQRRLHGAVTIRVLDALGALSGNLGVAGGGVSFTVRRRNAFHTERYGPPADRRGIPEALLGQGIMEADDPPVRAVMVDNGNPVAMLPDSHTVARALETRELVVVLEQFLTDTAERAHVVLPVSTMLEETDLLGSYGHHQLTASQPVARRPDGVRSDLEIYQALAERLGFGERMAGTAGEWAERLLEPWQGKLDLRQLQQCAVSHPEAVPVLFAGRRFATDDGRFHFLGELDLEPPLPEPDYPLQLGSFSTPKAQSSQWADPERQGPEELRAHPAAAGGLGDGALVRVVSRRAALELRLRLDPGVHPEMVLVPKGGWLRARRAANALVQARLTDMGLGAAYYDERVRLEPAG